MRHYLFIILAIIALSACNLATNLGTDGASIGFNDDEADNTGNINTGGDTGNNNATNIAVPPTNDAPPANDAPPTNDTRPTNINFTSFDNITENSNIDFTFGGYRIYYNTNIASRNIAGKNVTITLTYEADVVEQVKSDDTLYAIDGLTYDVGFISGSKIIIDDYSYSDSFFTMANPNDAKRQWNYQSYVLMNDIYYHRHGRDVHEYNYYVSSIGARTIGADLPVTGTAVFIGDGRAYYNSTSDTDGLETIAFDITADVNFGTDSIALTATEIGTNYGLDFTSTLSYNYKSNSPSGNIKSASDDYTPVNSRLEGMVNAKFYGDKAQELGGNFYMKNDKKSLIGAFGAKRDK